MICFALLGHHTHPKYKQGQKIIAAYKAGILFEWIKKLKVIAALTHRLKRRMRVHLNAAWNRIRVWGKQATRTKAQALRQRQHLVGGLHPQSQQQRSSIAAGSEESRPNEPRAGKFSQSSSLDKDVGIGSDRPAAWCQLPLFLTQLRSCFRAIAAWAITPLDPMIEKRELGGGSGFTSRDSNLQTPISGFKLRDCMTWITYLTIKIQHDKAFQCFPTIILGGTPGKNEKFKQKKKNGIHLVIIKT